MEPTTTYQIPYKILIVIFTILIILVAYSVRNNGTSENNEEEPTVSLCQIHFHFNGIDPFDDHALLSLLAVFKMNDFYIGQPVWGPEATLLYLCEHRLKLGLKQSTLEEELKSVLKATPLSSGRLAWSCA